MGENTKYALEYSVKAERNLYTVELRKDQWAISQHLRAMDMGALLPMK